ncbi:MAG: lipoyl(octanoyl) transferase LipB [Proteobacteria bacterium]|nr:lipoyl(octanoyl) transferase LipB [Pseudomonadota bacterium]
MNAPANIEQIEWRRSPELVDYPTAVAEMERRVAAIRDGTAPEMVWLLEHPPLYTAGTSAKAGDLLLPERLPVFTSGRGGEYTYHGPGQRVAYVMLDLKARGGDVRAHVRGLEQWIIDTLSEFGLTGERRSSRVGVWVRRPDGGEDKVAAIGVRVRKWVTYHGISINVAPDLSHYQGIVPCGIAGHGVTSLAKLGVGASLADVDAALKRTFKGAFKRSA